MYESPKSQLFRTTTEIQSRPDNLENLEHICYNLFYHLGSYRDNTQFQEGKIKVCTISLVSNILYSMKTEQ